MCDIREFSALKDNCCKYVKASREDPALGEPGGGGKVFGDLGPCAYRAVAQ